MRKIFKIKNLKFKTGAARPLVWMKYKKYYFAFSGAVLAVGIFAIFTYGLPLGLDFKGGTIAEYKVPGDVNLLDLESRAADIVEVHSVASSGPESYLIRMGGVEAGQKELLLENLKELNGETTELRFEMVGASFGPELLQKTLSAIAISAGLILVWVAIQFKSFKFGLSAIAAMFHDSLILIGAFALFGHFWDAQVDFLFVTALLTTLSFSVHDTIVVYDRIREIQKKEGGDIPDIANTAVTETMVRSLNNSFTIIFMLFALILLGGATLRWFSVALFIGTVAGTYSSPFVAVPLLVVADNLVQKFKKS